MRATLIVLACVATTSACAAMAQPVGPEQRAEQGHRQFTRGQALPNHYFSKTYAVDDWRGLKLRDPGEGNRWVRDEDGNLILVSLGTRVIQDIVVRGTQR